MRRSCFLVCILMTFLQQQAQRFSADSVHRHFLFVNPVKPFLGLANLNYEIRLGSRLAAGAAAEYEFARASRGEHPLVVLRTGPAFYPFVKRSDQLTGLYCGVNAGYVHYRSQVSSSGATMGTELGYRLIFYGRFFLQARVLANYEYSNRRLFPGFEGLLGIAF